MINVIFLCCYNYFKILLNILYFSSRKDAKKKRVEVESRKRTNHHRRGEGGGERMEEQRGKDGEGWRMGSV